IIGSDSLEFTFDRGAEFRVRNCGADYQMVRAGTISSAVNRGFRLLVVSIFVEIAYHTHDFDRFFRNTSLDPQSFSNSAGTGPETPSGGFVEQHALAALLPVSACQSASLLHSCAHGPQRVGSFGSYVMFVVLGDSAARNDGGWPATFTCPDSHSLHTRKGSQTPLQIIEDCRDGLFGSFFALRRLHEPVDQTNAFGT